VQKEIVFTSGKEQCKQKESVEKKGSSPRAEGSWGKGVPGKGENH